MQISKRSFPRACVLCSALSYESSLCAHCSSELYVGREPTVRKELDLTVKSLFAWRKDGWPALRVLVHSMKGIDDPSAWSDLALWMAEQFRTTQPRILVPIPSRRRNHALGLARALSCWTGWPVKDVLEVGGVRSQKLLNRDGRQSIRFDMKAGVSCKEFTDAVIVDDVVTTGATALAAFHAFKTLSKGEVWCLMDRRPCGSEGALL